MHILYKANFMHFHTPIFNLEFSTGLGKNKIGEYLFRRWGGGLRLREPPREGEEEEEEKDLERESERERDDEREEDGEEEREEEPETEPDGGERRPRPGFAIVGEKGEGEWNPR